MGVLRGCHEESVGKSLPLDIWRQSPYAILVTLINPWDMHP